MNTWQTWLKWAITQLSNSTTPKLDAMLILNSVIKKPYAHLLAFGENILNNSDQYYLNKLIKKRKKGEPIAYLIGKKEFWSLDICVCYNIFIPRADTEIIVEQTLKLFPMSYNIRMLELGTGTGAISLAIASEKPNWEITAVDCEIKAINLAYINATKLNINNICFLHSNWFDLLKGMYYNVIVSNPPYIDAKDPHLLNNDLKFEAKNALIAKNKGLFNLKMIIQKSHTFLLPGGWLLLEHGYQQGESVRKIFNLSGFKNIETILDYNGKERITYGQWFKKYL